LQGGTNGIGLDSVIHVASASPNYHVIIGARNLTKGESVLKDVQSKNIKGTVSLVQIDYTDDSSITEAAKKIKADFGRLDVLINNAGICPEESANEWPTRDQLRATFETNVFGPTVLTGALVPLLKASKAPKIINVSSSLASISMISNHSDPQSAVRYPAYRMTKSALNMLTAYQYYQLKEFGFKVWSYCPGYVVTDLGRDRETRMEQNIDSSETSAQGIVEILEGKRDGEVGKFVARFGQAYEW
jgi:NAD(P)-dependent dehydrogenase (short-subunit alcohol dehydrogenase family)